MLPSLRLIVAGFLCGFVVVFAGLRLATSLSSLHQALPSIMAAQAAPANVHGTWSAVPPLYDMRLVAGTSAPLPASVTPPPVAELPILAPLLRLDDLIMDSAEPPEPGAAVAAIEPVSTTADDATMATAEPGPALHAAEATPTATEPPAAPVTEPAAIAALDPSPSPRPESAPAKPQTEAAPAATAAEPASSDATASAPAPVEAATPVETMAPETTAVEPAPPRTSAPELTASDVSAPSLAEATPVADAMAIPLPAAKPEAQPAKPQRKKQKRTARRPAATTASGDQQWNWSGAPSSNSSDSGAPQ